MPRKVEIGDTERGMEEARGKTSLEKKNDF